MTFKELLDNIFLDLDEDYSDTTLITKMKIYINRGYKELAKREKLEQGMTKTVTNGKFLLPDECIKLLSVTQEQIPLPFRLEGRYVYVDTTDPVRIVFTYIPENLVNDNDIPDTNLSNDEFIINYAKWLYYLAEALEEEAKIYKLEYENYTIIKSLNNIEKIIDVYGVGGYVYD